jgi:hypothetical protein
VVGTQIHEAIEEAIEEESSDNITRCFIGEVLLEGWRWYRATDYQIMFGGRLFGTKKEAREFLEEANGQATLIQWKESKRCAQKSKHESKIEEQRALL